MEVPNAASLRVPGPPGSLRFLLRGCLEATLRSYEAPACGELRGLGPGPA